MTERRISQIEELSAWAKHSHSAEVMRIYAILNFFEHGKSVKELAEYNYCGESAIRNWINDFKEKGNVVFNISQMKDRKFNKEHFDWIVAYYEKNPCKFLDEVSKMMFVLLVKK